MKQVININFQGRVVPIEVTAFDLLKAYTESLNRHFANEEGKDEIINDIESRIGELFQERLTNGATCITDDDVNAVIKSMGRPEEFETADEVAGAAQPKKEETSGDNQYSSSTATHKRLYRDESNKVLGGVCAGVANYFGIDTTLVRIIFILSGVGFFAYILLWVFVPSNSGTMIGGIRKKLYRDGDDKLIAGVCSGIGNYFGINPWIPRILFLAPFLSFIFRWGHWGMMDFPNFLRVGFSPGALIIYIILWLVIPEAFTTAEKLEMKGEKVDMNSIKESVKEEMKGFQQRAEKFGKEAKAYAQEKGKVVSAEAGNIARRSRSGLGDIIALLAKIFAYLIIGSVCLGLIVALFGIGIFSISIFPLKDFLITDGWQNAYAWGTLLFFIAVPIIGIITWVIRRITKMKGGGRTIRATFICLWIVGWVSVVLLVSSLNNDFRYTSKNLTEQEIILNNPRVNKLELTSTTPLERYTRRHWLRFEPFEGIDDDTAYVRNYQIEIERSPNDSFKVSMIKMADGRTRNEAENLAGNIRFSAAQNDSLLVMDKGIAINTTEKFRNQRVVLIIKVPVGKHIKIDGSVGWNNNIHFSFFRNDDEFNFNYYDHDWATNEEYVMGADGKLYTLTGRLAGKQRVKSVRINDNGINITIDGEDTFRYHNNTPMNKVDSMQQKLDRERQRMNDSLQKAKDKIEKQLEKLNDNNDEPSPLSIYKVPGYGPVMNIN